MRNRLPSNRLFVATLFLLLLAPPAFAQTAADAPGRNVADMKFAAVPGMPTCATASVQSGDPSKGASILLAKMAAGCVFPWHWHTPNENLMMVSGSGLAEMQGGKAFTLKPGGFAQMPSKHVHQFSCPKGCMLYVNSDAAFDMHYVDADGKDMSPAEALKKVHETAAASPK